MIGMIKALFLAPHLHEALYWADLWGYDFWEWKFVGSEDKLHGYRPGDYPVFICGSHPPSDFEAMWNRLVILGFDVFDGQDIDVPDNIEVGTEWLS